MFDGLVLWSSDLASLGFPTLRHGVKNLKNLREADLAPLRMAKKSQGQLWLGFSFAVPTIAAAMTAVAILLFAPTPVAKATYQVTEKVGAVSTTTPCGTFGAYVPYASPLPPSVTFTPDVLGGKPVTISASSVQSIAAC